MRTRFALAATCVSLGVLAAPAIAASPSLKVTPTTVVRGHKVKVFGVVPGCTPGGQVVLLSKAFPTANEFAGLPAVYAVVAAHSAYSVTVKIPAGKKPGKYTITGRCGGGNLGKVAHLTVVAAQQQQQQQQG